MSKLEQLIAELCPDGVEYFELQEIFNMRNGYTPSKANADYWNDGTIPWFRMEDIREQGHILSDSIQHITHRAVKGKLFPADSIIIATSATIGEHALITVEFLSNQRFTCLVRKDDFLKCLDPMFVYYYCFLLDEWCVNNLNVSSFASVDMVKFAKFRFPLPPLPIQREIVRILDNFTELRAELTAELTARKKQYEYYRNELLTFGDDVPMVRLGDISELITKGTTPKTFTAHGINFVKLESFNNSKINPAKLVFVSEETHNKELKRSILKASDILFAIAGATIGKCAMVNKSILPANANQALAIIRLQEVVNKKYVFYCMQTKLMQDYIEKYNKTSAQPNLNLQQMNDFCLPLPSLEEQSRIVILLDKFDTLTTDITTGLPAEIEARNKQYEYYRDELLTFKEAGV